MSNPEALPSDQTCILEAESGKLDIKRREPGILFISLSNGSLLKLVIMTTGTCHKLFYEKVGVCICKHRQGL